MNETILARLFREGLTETTASLAAEVPGLAAHLPAALAADDAAFDADEAAADHQHLFGFNVFPYASVFLSEDGLLAGATSGRVRAMYAAAGFAWDDRAEPADHLAHELDFVAYLAAHADREAPGAALRRFLDGHLLGWLPAFVQAVGVQEHPFYAALAAATLAAVRDRRAPLGPVDAEPDAAFALPAPPPLLDDERTALKDIAAYLMTPPWAGLFLSRDDLGRLARAEGVPRGFGDRTLMAANLLRAAAEYDRLPSLLARLKALLRERDAQFAALAHPAAAPWRARLATTERLLGQIEAAAQL